MKDAKIDDVEKVSHGVLCAISLVPFVSVCLCFSFFVALAKKANDSTGSPDGLGREAAKEAEEIRKPKLRVDGQVDDRGLRKKRRHRRRLQ